MKLTMKKGFDEQKLRKNWQAATEKQREFALEEALEMEKRRVALIDLSYRKAAVFLTGAALLSAGLANMKDNLSFVWPAALCAIAAIISTVLVILPKFTAIRIARSLSPDHALAVSLEKAKENKFIRHRRHTYGLERDILRKRIYMYVAGLSLILGTLSLFAAL